MILVKKVVIALLSASVAMVAHMGQAEGFLFTEDADDGVVFGDVDTQTSLEVMSEARAQPLVMGID